VCTREFGATLICLNGMVTNTSVNVREDEARPSEVSAHTRWAVTQQRLWSANLE
jgi:hypothetical protein